MNFLARRRQSQSGIDAFLRHLRIASILPYRIAFLEQLVCHHQTHRINTVQLKPPPRLCTTASMNCSFDIALRTRSLVRNSTDALQGFNRSHYEYAMARSHLTSHSKLRMVTRLIPPNVKSLIPEQWKARLLNRF